MINLRTIIVKSEELNLPEKMAIKLKGKELELIDTQEGILIKPIRKSKKSVRGILKGTGVSTELFSQIKKRRKGIGKVRDVFILDACALIAILNDKDGAINFYWIR